MTVMPVGMPIIGLVVMPNLLDAVGHEALAPLTPNLNLNLFLLRIPKTNEVTLALSLLMIIGVQYIVCLYYLALCQYFFIALIPNDVRAIHTCMRFCLTAHLSHASAERAYLQNTP